MSWSGRIRSTTALPEASTSQRISQTWRHRRANTPTYRFFFVQRQLSPGERNTLQHITRGLPDLRVLRTIMDQVYQLGDWRCRTESALAKPARLRQRVRTHAHVHERIALDLLREARTPTRVSSIEALSAATAAS